MFRLKMFAVGILTGLGSGVLEFLISIIYPGFGPGSQAKNFSLVAAAILEESLKFGVARKIFETIRSKANPFLNLILIGVGFSAIEFILNISWRSFNLELFYSSYLGLFFLHSATVAIFGYYFLKLNRSIFNGFLVLFSAAVLHFLFNASVIIGFNHWIVYLILFLLIVVLAGKVAVSYKR